MRRLRRFFMGTIDVSNERGVVVIAVALLLVALLSFGALALDIGSAFVVRNELQNAADAGALAAARALYLDGTQVNPGANALGVAAAKDNSAQSVQVELVGNPDANTGDVQRGHWKWSDQTFTPTSRLFAVNLGNASTADLDADLDFINAVRVRVRRQTVPVRTFLSKVMSFSDFQMQTEAVAYVGFPGAFLQGEIGKPIAICQESLLTADGKYSCNTGRMINSGANVAHNTGGWSNFTQSPCQTASTPTVRPYVGCSASPAPELTLGIDVGTTGGQLQTIWDDVYDCWLASHDTDSDGRPDTVKNMTLVVIKCPGNNVGNCSEVVGGVNVNMVWMIRQARRNNFDWVPLEMTGSGSFPDWSCPASITQGLAPAHMSDQQFLDCWSDFVTHFELRNHQDVSIGAFSLSDLNKTMFFLPDCDPHVPTGGTGGKNFGVLAKIPVLVK